MLAMGIASLVALFEVGSEWHTPLGTVPVDRPMVERLIRAKLIGVLDAAHAQRLKRFVSCSRDPFATDGNRSDDGSPVGPR
jgi:hypothetical protein